MKKTTRSKKARSYLSLLSYRNNKAIAHFSKVLKRPAVLDFRQTGKSESTLSIFYYCISILRDLTARRLVYAPDFIFRSSSKENWAGTPYSRFLDYDIKE